MKQERAIELALSGNNIFLTGKAGTGKTYTLNKIIKKLKNKNKNIAKTASTGIASTLIGGTTVHSWSSIGKKEKLTEDDLFSISRSPYSRERILNTQILIIDEISMLKGIQLDLIDEICKFVRKNKKPFGGIQIIVSGDFFQLPPVDKNINKDYCFKSKSWQMADFKICYLEKIYRQSQDVFIELLNSIRKNSVNNEQKEILKYLTTIDKKENAIELHCKNANVDIINTLKLNEINEKSHFFKMEENGKEYPLKILKKNCLAPEVLILKKGAKVMFLRNDFNRGIVNGTQGIVVRFDEYIIYNNDGEEVGKLDNIPYVKLKNGKVEPAIPAKWEMEEYDINQKKNVITAQLIQIPLKLAWAVTIHKSQGATFNSVHIDLSDVFEYSMGYVALSRATRLDDISLSAYNEKSLMVNPEIINIDNLFIQKSKENENPYA